MHKNKKVETTQPKKVEAQSQKIIYVDLSNSGKFVTEVIRDFVKEHE